MLDGIYQLTQMKTPDTVKINSTQIVPLHQSFPRCSNSKLGYTMMSHQLLRGAQPIRSLGRNAQQHLLVSW